MASELKVDTISEKTTASGVTIDGVELKDGSVKGNGLGRKNLVMNGDFRIAQRGTSFSPLTTGSYPADRWNWQLNAFSGAVDSTISTGTPTGFGNSLKLDCTTANTSVAANNFVLLRTHWEGQDIQHLAYGTSAAKSVTISFWVFSTKTGTFNVSLYNADTSHSYIVDETVDTASTWEKKTITITGDTANAFNNDANRSLSLYFAFSAGTDYQGTSDSWISGFKIASSNIDNFFDSTANEIYITGVQMEVGSVATDFEVRPIAEEQSLCNRYYQIYIEGFQGIATGAMYNSTTVLGVINFEEMRVAPSLEVVTGTNYYRFWRNNSSDDFNDFAFSGAIGKKSLRLQSNTNLSGTAGQCGTIEGYHANAKMALDAEL
jgi:hypothetical protein